MQQFANTLFLAYNNQKSARLAPIQRIKRMNVPTKKLCQNSCRAHARRRSTAAAAATFSLSIADGDDGDGGGGDGDARDSVSVVRASERVDYFLSAATISSRRMRVCRCSRRRRRGRRSRRRHARRCACMLSESRSARQLNKAARTTSIRVSNLRGQKACKLFALKAKQIAQLTNKTENAIKKLKYEIAKSPLSRVGTFNLDAALCGAVDVERCEHCNENARKYVKKK